MGIKGMKEEKVIGKPYNIQTNKQTNKTQAGSPRGYMRAYSGEKHILVGTAGNHRLWLACGLSGMHAHDSQNNCFK